MARIATTTTTAAPSQSKILRIIELSLLLMDCRFRDSPNDYRVAKAYFTLLEVGMKYLCLVYQEEKEEVNVPREAIEQAKKDYGAFAEDIKKSGNYVGSHGLQHTDQATTVRVRNGKLSATDGPFAETKEQLGGYFLIEAKDRAEAIQIASRIPSAKWGSIEVRPVWGNGK